MLVISRFRYDHRPDSSTLGRARRRRQFSSAHFIAAALVIIYSKVATDKVTSTSQRSDNFVARLKRSRIFRALRHGLITGAADDDPDGIGLTPRQGAAIRVFDYLDVALHISANDRHPGDQRRIGRTQVMKSLRTFGTITQMPYSSALSSFW